MINLHSDHRNLLKAEFGYHPIGFEGILCRIPLRITGATGSVQCVFALWAVVLDQLSLDPVNNNCYFCIQANSKELGTNIIYVH